MAHSQPRMYTSLIRTCMSARGQKTPILDHQAGGPLAVARDTKGFQERSLLAQWSALKGTDLLEIKSA